MMQSLPLVSHAAPDSIIAWRADGAVTVREFLAEVSALASTLPVGAHFLNLCSDRYRFSVGLAAGIVSGKVSLLPSTHTPGVIRQVKAFAPDMFCLTDHDRGDIDLPQIPYPEAALRAALPQRAFAVPQIDTAQRIAVIFTSGSTGTPQPHVKTWGALVRCVQAEALRLELPREQPWTVIGTVPPQHMFGFESTVLMPWHNGNALSHAQPFYPADICHALAAVPAGRVLVSSPLHLRALVESDLVPPALTEVVSATAPLSVELAKHVEARFGAPLFEIYGSTETGQIASRRTSRSTQWRLFPGVRFSAEGEHMRASGGHVAAPVLMGDVIETVDEEHFLLHGRLADMINIAGKRQSLANLNHLLNSIPGVVDGVFFMPDHETGHQAARVSRLAACVVAPGMSAPQLVKALREHLDPVFLPRPLIFVAALPRNGTGKLPREALQSLLRGHGGISTL